MAWSGPRAARDIWWFFLLVLVGDTTLTAFNIVRSARNEATVGHTLNVLNVLDRLQGSLIDTETGARGFALTGDEEFLAPYQAALPVTPLLLAELRTLMAEPNQQEQLEELEPLVHRRLDNLRTLIEQRRRPDRNPSREAAIVSEGKRMMDSLRRQIAALDQDERRQLDRRARNAQETLRTSVFTSLIGGVLTIAVLILTKYLMRRENEIRRHTEETLTRAKAELEIRVAERTSELRQVVADLNNEAHERELAADRLQQMTSELMRSNRELEQFAYVASHDLQEPLRKIQSFGDRLKTRFKESLSEQGQEYIERMQSSAGRMRRLIDDLLSYSRVTTRPQPLVDTDLNAVIQEVLADLEEAISVSGAQISVGPLPVIRADPIQMRQLLQNLLSNALKFHKPGEPAVVSILATELPSDSPGGLAQPAVRIDVTDQGIGFDQTYCDRIFQLFQRLHGRGHYEGTGIGLAVVRKIVERHGGAITAQSAPGAGATFSVVLPMSLEEAWSPAPKSGLSVILRSADGAAVVGSGDPSAQR